MTVLVTGATGLVGNNVVRRILETQPRAKVRCLVRANADPRPLSGLPVEIVGGDITNADDVGSAIDGAISVIHAAADVRIGWSHVAEMRAVNVDGTANIAEAARRVGARMVHVSTFDTWRGGACDRIPYVATKKEAEGVVLAAVETGLEAIIVSPAFVLGPYDWKPTSGRLLLAAATGWVPFAPRGCLGLCDARDVADAILFALKQGRTRENYPVTGHAIIWIDALCRFARLGGRPVPICRFDPVAHRAVGLAGDLIGRLRAYEPRVNSAAMLLAGRCDRPVEQKELERLEVAFRPVEDTLADTWAWFKSEGYV